jgi:Ca-activated chloride channel family protein
MRDLRRYPAVAALLALAACTPAPVSRDAPKPPAGEQAAPTTGATAKDLGEIVVTGSRTRGEAYVSSTPVTALMQAPLWTPVDRENYGKIGTNPVHRVAEDPVSTFSIDVDTGSYSNVRRMLNEGRLPPRDAVRVEEMINYFDYAYAAPRDPSVPFGVVTEIAATPWNPKTRLLHIGIRGWKPDGPRRASNLVFLVDVSGSMQDPDKLPLVKASLKLLAG